MNSLLAGSGQDHLHHSMKGHVRAGRWRSQTRRSAQVDLRGSATISAAPFFHRRLISRPITDFGGWSR
jgi:hypothetical protein